jgi:hypothetical protein
VDGAAMEHLAKALVLKEHFRDLPKDLVASGNSTRVAIVNINAMLPLEESASADLAIALIQNTVVTIALQHILVRSTPMEQTS